MLDIVLVLAVLATLLVVVALCQPLAVRLRLAPVVLLAVVGVAIGAASSDLMHLRLSSHFGEIVRTFADLPVGSEIFIYVFLPLLIFEAAITADVRRMLEDAAPILTLAVVATVVTTGVVGLALWPIAGLPLTVCLLLGSVVATTDPAAVIAVFRDVGAPARLTRLVEGEALLNDAAAIALFVVLLGMIVSAREPDIGGAAREFTVAFLGGAAFGALAGRALLEVIPWVRGDRLAEATLTVALAYLVFIAADRVLHVSGVVAVLAAGLTVSAFGRSRITPYNWSFLVDLWDQLAFWAHSLIFLLASILVPKLLVDMQFHDIVLLAALLASAFAARLLVQFLLMPLLSLLRLTQPISTAYKLTITWGGLRGALTLVLALAVTENPALTPEVQQFVAVLATGLVLFTLLVNGTTLRAVIRLFGLDRLSPVAQALRDRILALSYSDIADTIRASAREHEISPAAVTKAPQAGRGLDCGAEAAGSRGERPQGSRAPGDRPGRARQPGTRAGAQYSGAAPGLTADRAGALEKRRDTRRGREERRTSRLPAQRRSDACLPALLSRRLFSLSALRRHALSRRPAGRPVRNAALHAPPDPGACRGPRRAVAHDLRRTGRRTDRRHSQEPADAHDPLARLVTPAISGICCGARSPVPEAIGGAARDGTLRRPAQ